MKNYTKAVFNLAKKRIRIPSNLVYFVPLKKKNRYFFYYNSGSFLVLPGLYYP